MKKILSIFLIIFLVFSLTACTSKQDNSKPNTTNNTIENNASHTIKYEEILPEDIGEEDTSNENSTSANTSKEETKNNKENTTVNQPEPDTLVNEDKEPKEPLTKHKYIKNRKNIKYTDIYYDAPDLSYVGMEMNTQYQSSFFESYDEGVYITVLAKLDTTESEAVNAMSSASLDYYMGEKIPESLQKSTTIKEAIKVNDMDVFVIQDESPEYLRAYSFVIDGVPCVIAGYVMGSEQAQEDIDYLNEVLELMVESVRVDS
jgi:hypothetical protein